MGEPISDIPKGSADHSHSPFSSLVQNVKDKLPIRRPFHPTVSLPPEDFYRTPKHPVPEMSPGAVASYEFTAADWQEWLKFSGERSRAMWKKHWQDEGHNIQEALPPSNEELRKMGILAKAFANGIRDVFVMHEMENTLPAGLSLPPIFVGYAGKGNLASITPDGERITLDSGSIWNISLANINKAAESYDGHGIITPLQRVTLAGIHEGDHIIYKAVNPHTKTANYIVRHRDQDSFTSQPNNRDDSLAAYDAQDIELPAVRRELKYAVAHRYPNSVIQALQGRIRDAESKRKDT